MASTEPTAARRRGGPAQLRPGHRRLLGRDARRRGDPDAGPVLLLRTGLLALHGRLAVHLLRGLRHPHQPRRRLARRPLRAEDDALHGPRHPGLRAVDARLRAAGVAGRPLRDGLAGLLGDRQGPDQDELQERGQAGRARGRRVLALPLGRDPDRLQERAQGGRLLPRRADADAGRVPGLDGDPGRVRSSPPLLVGRAADARAPRPPRREGQVQAHVLQQPRGQRPRRRPHLPLRLARRLVRGRPAGLPRDRARLELLADRRLPGDLGDRLRGRAGGRPGLRAPAGRGGRRASPTGRPRPGWPSRWRPSPPRSPSA